MCGRLMQFHEQQYSDDGLSAETSKRKKTKQQKTQRIRVAISRVMILICFIVLKRVSFFFFLKTLASYP